MTNTRKNKQKQTRNLRIAIWIAGAIMLCIGFVEDPVMQAVKQGRFPGWIENALVFTIVAFHFGLNLPATVMLSARSNRRMGDWTIASILLPILPALILSFLPSRSEPADDEEIWEVVVLGVGCLLLLIAGIIFSENTSSVAGIRILFVAGAFFALRGYTELHRCGLLLRGVMVSLSLIFIIVSVMVVKTILRSGLEAIEELLIMLVLIGFLVTLSARDARQRTLSAKRWSILSLVLPFLAPIVLAFMPTPKIASLGADKLVFEFKELFNEFLEAEVKRMVAEGTKPNSLSLTETCVKNAKTTLMLKHNLAPGEAERVAELFARSWDGKIS